MKNHVVSRPLAEKLKEAGFPQKNSTLSKSVNKLIEYIQDTIERDYYNSLWNDFLNEQHEQVKRMDKKIQQQSKIIAERVAKDLQRQIDYLKKEQE